MKAESDWLDEATVGHTTARTVRGVVISILYNESDPWKPIQLVWYLLLTFNDVAPHWMKLAKPSPPITHKLERVPVGSGVYTIVGSKVREGIEVEEGREEGWDEGIGLGGDVGKEVGAEEGKEVGGGKGRFVVVGTDVGTEVGRKTLDVE